VQPTQRQEQRPQLKRCEGDRDPDEQRSARPRSGHGARRRSGSRQSVRVELLGENTLADFRISFARSQLEVLLPQPLDLLALLAGRQIRPQALVGLGLAHPLAQRLGMDPEITSDVRDRTAITRANLTPRTSSSSGYFLGLDMALRISSPQDSILGSRSPRNPVRLKARGMVAPSVAPGRLALHHSGAST
jgi:hypothetical protein